MKNLTMETLTIISMPVNDLTLDVVVDVELAKKFKQVKDSYYKELTDYDKLGFSMFDYLSELGSEVLFT
ncbi:hypothetical protein HOK51_04305 [Candidatus Woesearchaeota archaeon]|jgi:hypothetical protein|nr:hypothetical protein [Candidatus Woesearchaeota archaeon]MBT6519045.1 hypothetical protein [Candidatus Woesearchaeota archaeon]MBT7367481.1 hypothetical protein [Candidatus Woesearchaeota archaeon]